MQRTVIAIVTSFSLAACFGIGGTFVKELASTHVIDTGLRGAEVGVIGRGAERHGCTPVERNAQLCDAQHQNCIAASNSACPALPAKNHSPVRPTPVWTSS